MDDDQLRDMASGACQEALSFGVGEDVFLRLARSVRAKCNEPGAARAELVAAWNDLPDSLRCHPGLKRLYRAAQRA